MFPGTTFVAVGGVVEGNGHEIPAVETSNFPRRSSSFVESPGPKPDFRNVVRQLSGSSVGDVAKRSRVSDDNDNSRSSAEDEGDLHLTTKIIIETFFRPSYKRECWDHDKDSNVCITTFELLCTAWDARCLRALAELRSLLERDVCDRFYVLDEIGGWALVVCGKATAFWSGTTASMRATLKGSMIPFEFVPQDKTRSTTAFDSSRLAQAVVADDSRRTLYFKGNYAVRAAVDSVVPLSRKDAQLRIIASCPFPYCTIKVSSLQTVERFSRNTNKPIYTSTCSGYFTVVDIDKLVRGFAGANGAHDANVSFEASPLTKDLDDAARRMFRINAADKEESDDFF